MAVVIEANYSKKLGLPEYSSHQYSLTIRTEVTDLSAIEAESERLYGLLQSAVDQEIRNPGWLPGDQNGGRLAQAAHTSPAYGSANTETRWKCSEPQQKLILKIVNEHNLDRNAVDALAHDRCGVGIKELNKLQASAVIDELLQIHGKATRKGGRHHSFSRGAGTSGRAR